MGWRLTDLQRWREELGLSVSDVARASHTSDVAVNRCEMTPTPGGVSREEAERIARVIGIALLERFAAVPKVRAGKDVTRLGPLVGARLCELSEE